MIKDVIQVMKARERIKRQLVTRLLHDNNIWPLYFEEAHIEITRNLSQPDLAFQPEEKITDDPRSKFLSTLDF